MAVNPAPFPHLPAVAGIEIGTFCAGIKQTVRDDLTVFQLAEQSTCAAVFTRNAFRAAPVRIAQTHLPHRPRWLLINSGNANAGTGQPGHDATMATCSALARLVGGKTEQVMPFSTGVIGQLLPANKIVEALPKAVARLDAAHWEEAARAIMTTDTFAKGATASFFHAGAPITINGIAKGAGMIQPNMATMLAYIGTDAKIDHDLLQRCLEQAVEISFNRITVDGDTSTNDACVLMASGRSNAPVITEDSELYHLFVDALTTVCKTLAEAIIRDGEGATKLIRIVVDQAENDQEAVRVGKTIAHSPLVKTAFFASDPNWGRILAAVGRSDIKNLNVDSIEIYLDDVCIVRNGGRAENYTEEAGQEVMNREEITIGVKLKRGQACQEILTCDFSYDYVRINAEYRT